ncbi:MAG: hypothetical protein ACRDKT_07740 [Actinomycetota bacterium]
MPGTSTGHHVQDYPWSGPPAIWISEWENPPEWGYQTANSVGGDGRFVAFYRIRRDGPERLLLHNVARDRNRLIARPPADYRRCYDCGKFPSDGGFRLPDFSLDGRYLVFATDYRLVAGDRNRYADVYRYDIQTREYVLVSVGTDGRPGNSPSSAAAVSDDGRFVAFASGSSDFVEGDTNRATDVFVRDLEAQTTTRVSVASDGTQGDWSPDDADVRYVRGNSHTPDISGNGSLVSFVSIADTLVEGDTNDANDVFVHDVRGHTTRRVSVTSSGEQLTPFEYCESASCFRDGAEEASISGNGEVVVFRSHANGLVPEDENQNVDIFTHELATGLTERVSEPTGGGESYGPGTHECGHNGQCFFFIYSYAASISYDADRVYFLTGAPRITHVDDGREAGDDTDMFVHDRSTKVTQLVNRKPDGSWAPAANVYPGQISADGNWAIYSSDGRGIAPGDRRFGDVFLQELVDEAFGD